jgi:hypothetical protein
MVIRHAGGWIGLGLTLAALALPEGGGRSCRAQTGARHGRPEGIDPLERPLAAAAHSGRPILVAVTSRGRTEPGELWYAMIRTPRARELRAKMEFVELTLEDDGARVRQLGVAGTPALCVLRRRGVVIEKYLEQAMPRDLAGLLEWAEWTANVASVPGRPAVDPALARTGLSGGQAVQASPQVPQAPPQAAVPSAPAQAFATVPVVTAPTPPPVALALSSPPIYLQQAAPTVVVGPTPPANVFVTHAAAPPTAPLSGAPSLSPQAAVQPPLQLTLAAPQAQPTLGLLQPQAAVAAPTAQAAPGVGLVLCNPNAIDRLIGAIGRLLAQRGLPRLQMNAATPATFTPTLVPFSQAGLPLALGQPQTPTAVPQAQQAPVMPSPQGGPAGVQSPGNASLWSRLFHKN